MDVADSIKKQVSCYDVWEHYGKGKLKRGRTISPYASRNATTLSIKEHSWYDFHEAKGGDCISLVMHLLGIDFKAAIERLQEDFSISKLHLNSKQISSKQVQKTRKKNNIEKYKEWFDNIFNSLVMLERYLMYFKEGIPFGIMWSVWAKYYPVLDNVLYELLEQDKNYIMNDYKGLIDIEYFERWNEVITKEVENIYGFSITTS